MSPAWVAFILFVVGCALIVAGVYLLAGPGWAVLAGALPFISISAVIMRGV